MVGGGIHGACIAWDATLRGLSVALLERDDFGAATSANSLRIVHGGLRYLARGDFARMRESIRERSALLRIAPGLVAPLPVLVPTEGGGVRSRAAFAAALAANDLLSADRNRGLGLSRRLPRGRLLAPAECRRLFPAFDPAATGGALWYDAQILHPERLTLAFLLAASQRGAALANYFPVERVLSAGGAVSGVLATDRLTGSPIEVRGRVVVVAAGPWTSALAGQTPAPPLAFALNLVVARRLAEVAVGLRARTGADGDPVVGGGRFLFLAPQGEATLLGTWYAPSAGASAQVRAARGVAALVAEFNEACPALALRESDVVRCQWGWLPLKAGRESGRATALAERPRLIDHGKFGGVRGMLSVEGVKYTTARGVAEQTVDRVVAALGLAPRPCTTAVEPLEQARLAREGDAVPLEAAVRRAARDEMALRFSDIVFRRTGLGALTGPDAAAVGAAARIAAAELGWTGEQQAVEIARALDEFRAPAPVGEPAG